MFDCDRTLVDLQNFTDYAAALEDLRTLLDGWSEFDVLDADWDAPTLECMAILVALSHDDRWPAASAAVASRERAAIPRSRAMPGLGRAREACADVPYAVVTLLPSDVAREALAFHDFAADLTVGRDPRIRAKPHGDGLLVAAERLGVPASSCVMIGDSSWDCVAAADAGMPFIGVPASPGAFGADVEVADSLLDAIARARGR